MVDEFKIHVDYDNGVIPIIHIAGEITSEADEEIVNCYASIPAGKKGRVLIDFSKTAYINSAGIATLISLIRKVMDIVGLTDFVLIHDNIEQALK